MAVSVACLAIYWPTPGFKGRTFRLCSQQMILYFLRPQLSTRRALVGNVVFVRDTWYLAVTSHILWGSMILKHKGKWMSQGNAAVVSWNWEKCFCCSKLVSALSMVLSSVLSWRVSQAWNPRQIQLTPGTWSLGLSQASVHLLWFPCWCRWCCLLSTWSSRLWPPCRGCGGFDETLSLFCQFFFLSCKATASSAKRRLVIVPPPMLTVPSWSSKASVMILSRSMWNRLDESRYPCRTPIFIQIHSPMLPLKRTALATLS